MLWTEKYRPRIPEDIIGQEQVVKQLGLCARTGSVPHMMLTGQHGTGKTSSIECFARQLYGENWQMNTSIFQTADLFIEGKNYLEQDERYFHLYQKQASLLANFKYIIKSYAALRPLNADFKLMVFEDAHAMTREAQQALRRIMERTSATCRFVLTTTNPSAIIPAITSRCLPLFFAPIDSTLMKSHLAIIREKESAGPETRPCDKDDLELIAHASRGDLRRAIMLLQLCMLSGTRVDLAGMTQSETGYITSTALAAIRKGDIRTAMRELESLMINYGLSGSDVLTEVRTITQRDFNHPLLAIALADTDMRISHGNNEFVQIGSLLAECKEVFT
jgi:replication factor C small subunit